jgi:hypothetical protein
VLGDLFAIVDLLPQPELEVDHGVVVAPFALERAAVIDIRENAVLHHVGDFRRRERPPRANAARRGELGELRFLLVADRRAGDEAAERPLVDPAGHVGVDGGICHRPLERRDPLQLLDQQFRARHVVFVALVAQVLHGLRLRPLAGAHQHVEVGDAVELRLLVEQRLDPLVAVALAPQVLEPRLALVGVPRDLLCQRGRAEQRRPVQLVHVPRRRRRAARGHDRL